MSEEAIERCGLAVAGFKERVKGWQRDYPGVPLVFNQDLLDVDFRNIRHIWVADNPGKQELAAGRYLVPAPGEGTTAGNNAEQFFRWAGIGSQVLVLNKTPIYTEKTADLAGYRAKHPELIAATQAAMAELTFILHREISRFSEEPCHLWISGLAGCWNSKQKAWRFRNLDGSRPAKATLPEYFEALRLFYGHTNEDLQSRLHIIKHFSRWAILSDLRFPNGVKVSINRIFVNNTSPSWLLNELTCQPYAKALFLPLKPVCRI